MKKKRVKAQRPDQVSLLRIVLELGKSALGAVIRAVVSHWLDHR